MPHSTALIEPLDQSGYHWAKSHTDSQSMTRDISNLERMFVILNQTLNGQSCPIMGASITLRGREFSTKYKPLNTSQLHARAVQAFYQTRWKYPTVAARILDGQRFSYQTESREDVELWAHRTVFTVCQNGGWPALRDRLSRETSLPTPDGDLCLFYLVVQPDETTKPELREFDVLMRVHHANIDGSGIRAVLNEFLERLGDPLPEERIVWAQETQRLLPAAVAVAKAEEPEANSIPVIPEEGVRAFHKADVGLPVYRPDILGPPKPEHKGTLQVSHTFEDPSFLPQVQAATRKHKAKLTAVLHAAMLKAVYELSELKPDPQDVYHSGSPMDLRNGYLRPEYCNRSEYVNLAVAIQPITVPCSLFGADQESEDPFWRVAACISDQWEAIKSKKHLAQTSDLDAQRLVEALSNNKKPTDAPSASPPKPRTCPTYSSDPPGSQGLQNAYPVKGFGELSLAIESYQLSSEQTQTVVSARSHSWNGLLTLCVAFNAVRNPKEKMQEFLGKWTEIVAQAAKVEDDAANGHSELESSNAATSEIIPSA